MDLFNNRNKRLMLLYGGAGLGILLSLIRMIIISKHAEKYPGGGLYHLIPSTAGTLFAIISIMLLAAVILAGLCLGTRVRINGKKMPRDMQIVTLVSAGAIGLGTIVGMLLGTPGTLLFTVLITLFGLISAARQALYGLKISPFKSKAFGMISLGLPLYFAARMLRDFMVQSYFPTATSGAYQIVMLASFMFFFLFEGEATVGMRKMRIYTVAGMVATVSGPIYLIPAVILFVTSGLGSGLLTVFALSDIAVWVYIVMRMRIVLASKVKKKAKDAEELEMII